MKKVLFTLLLAFGITGLAQAQQYGTAIGLKGGFPGYGAVSVKHNLGGSSYIEGNLGGGYRHLWIQGLYEKNFNIEGGLDWYIGGGADFGFWSDGYRYYRGRYNDYYYGRGGAWGGLDGIIGIEYTFDEIPINLALDATPNIRLFPYVGFGIYGSFAVRFAIK